MMPRSDPGRGAAAVIIGNEVLTAKVRDENGPHLASVLRQHGVPLLSMAVVPDDVDAIVEAVSSARRRARFVFTSGGIGPTHDDVTVAAVARALGRPVVRIPEAEAMVRAAYQGRPMPEAALRLANAPLGSRLLTGAHPYPLLACEELFLLPGVPQLFRLQLETALVGLHGAPVTLCSLYIQASEPDIAPALEIAASEHPEVAIGSYPTFDRQAEYRVRVTVEHVDPSRVHAVVDRLTTTLPPGAVLRVE